MTDDSTAAALVERLSRHERRMILSADDRGEIRALDDETAEDFEAIGITGEDGWIDVLTPLGRQIHRILAEREER